MAPVPLYNSFEDIARFGKVLEKASWRSAKAEERVFFRPLHHGKITLRRVWRGPLRHPNCIVPGQGERGLHL